MPREIHAQWDWNEELADDLRRLVRLAIRADLDRGCDVTSVALLPYDLTGSAVIVAREEGTVCGLGGVATLVAEFHSSAIWEPSLDESVHVSPGTVIGRLVGKGLDLLAIERTLLNYLSLMSGIATQTRRFVQAVRGTSAAICDTRKAPPGWNRLAKYAVRCGGGTNHRRGLYDALLIKDNHLAALAAAQGRDAQDPALAALAVEQARAASEKLAGGLGTPIELPLEIEVDTLEQLKAVLTTQPDIVLLDNFAVADLDTAVRLRNATAPEVLLEASGGITQETVRAIAETGVDRISIGALTHSAPALDLAMDWSWDKVVAGPQ